MEENEEHFDDVEESRRVAVQMTTDAAFQGNSLAGSLMALELLAEPFYLGLDTDPDDSDMDVFP